MSGHFKRDMMAELTAAYVLRGAGGAEAESPRAPVETPDSLRSIAFARILDLVSEGEIVGFADQAKPLTCYFLNETPAANADGTLNFKNIQIDTRTGTQTQDYIKGFGSTENEGLVNTELRVESPYTRTVTNLNLSAVRIRISTPGMSSTNTTNGDITGTTVRYQILLSTDGGPFISALTGAMTGKTTTKYERSHRIDLPPATSGWSLRVVRSTPNSGSAALQNSTFIESFAEIIDAKLRYPMSALVASVFDAEQFNNIPSRAFRLRGRIIRVPSNYNPDTGVYTGVWDGTFQSRYSRNPAWVFYDLVTNTRYGLGHLVPPELIDKWNLYRIAMYCDQLVPNGFGGMERRFEASLYLQSQQDATRVLQDMATMFRGIIYASGGSVTAVADMPEDPVYTYNQTNVVDGQFVYQGTDKLVRHTVALVSWNDLSDFSRAKVEYVDDEDAIARYGVQQTEVIAIGCTSQGQARRLGKYILATERYETDSVSFSVGLDGTVAAPGKIILIADPMRAGRRTGGRISAATLNSITVDMLPTVAAGDKITVTLPDATIQERTVQSIAGNTITMTANFTAIPAVESVWLVQSTTLYAQRFRVIAVTEARGDTLGYTITAIQQQAGKFDYTDNGTIISEKPISDVPTSTVPTPTGFSLTARDVADTNTTRKIATIAWTDVSVAVGYDVMWRQAEGPWTSLGKVSVNTVDIANVLPGPFEVQVTAINSLGAKSLPGFGGPFDIAAVQTPPGYVEVINSRADDLEQDLSDEITQRAAADVAEATARNAADVAEANTRAAAILQTAQDAANALLNAQLTINAAIATEQTIRQNADESLASQITSVAAGSGEQFDSAKVFYFDTDLEGWTGNGTPAAATGYLRPANAASNPYVQSPTGLAIDGAKYKYAKVRIRKTGTPVWAGQITGYNSGGSSVGTLTIPAPAFEPDGDATIDFKDIPWTGTIDRVRLVLSTAQTASNYFTIDYVAVGRFAPGASIAALQDEATARVTADAAEVTARTTLATQMRGGYTGTDVTQLTQGLLYNELQARVTADSAIVSSVTALTARVTTAEGNITSTSTALNALTTRVTTAEGNISSTSSAVTALDSRLTSAEGVNTSQATAITNLTTRITSAENINTSQATQLTNLTSRVDATETVNGAQGTALTNLDTRTTQNTNDIATQSTALTQVNSQITRLSNSNPNLIANPTYALDTAGWFMVGSATASRQTGTSGTFGQISTTSSQSIYYTDVAYNGNGTYVAISGDFIYAGSNQQYMQVQFFDASNASLGYGGLTNISASEWLRFNSPSIAVPNGTAKIRFMVVLQNSTTLFYLRNIKLERTAIGVGATPYSTDAEIVANATATQLLKTTAKGGGNLLINSAFNANTNGWSFANTHASWVNFRRDQAGSNWVPAGMHTIGCNGGTQGLADIGQNVPVTQLLRYAVSVYAAVHRCTVYPYVQFYDASAAAIGSAVLGPSLNSTGQSIAGGVGLDAWTRLGFFVTAPANARTMRVVLRTQYNGTANPYGWFCRPLVEEVSANKTDYGAWNAGGTELSASYAVTLDVNNYVTGFQSMNDGTTGIFQILADKFAIVSPAGGARTEYSSGNWRVYDSAGTLRVRMGIW